VGDSSVEELTALLADAGASALIETMRALEAGTVCWTLQDETLVTYASKITADELTLAPTLSAQDAWRRVRASTDSSPSTTLVAGVRLRVLEASPLAGDTGPAAAGVSLSKTGLVLGMDDGALCLDRVVPEGRRAMEGAAWARGARLPENARWGPA
jgi:methionyl-tRNA formyltransferase